MARPQKNNADYFTHDADMRNDIKVKALRRRFSHTGYAVWCYYLEALTDSDFFALDYSPTNQELLAADFDITVEELQSITEYAVKIGLLQLEADTETIYSEAHRRRFSMLLTKRSRDRERLACQNARQNSGDNAPKNGKSQGSRGDNSHSKGEESIGEEKIGKESKGKKKIEYPYQDIVALWNSICLSRPKVKSLTEARKSNIKARLTDLGGEPETWTERVRELFERVEASDFLSGRNGRWDGCCFDWVVSSRNWVKLCEGNYDNKGAQGANGQPSVTLGAGEFIDAQGRRTYGSGRATIPMDAPPRPSERYAWNESNKEWVLL